LVLRNITTMTAVVTTVIMIWTAPTAAGAPNDSSSLANTLSSIGCIVPAATAGAMSLADNERQERAGRQMLDAMLATSLVTYGLKQMTGAPRPSDPEANDGFPSGHTSFNYAFARAISAEYEEWRNAAYLWATAVGWSRLRRNNHTFGQVAAGAVLGWYIADRSVGSKGGIFGGLIAQRHLTPAVNQPQCPTTDLKLELWQATW